MAGLPLQKMTIGHFHHPDNYAAFPATICFIKIEFLSVLQMGATELTTNPPRPPKSAAEGKSLWQRASHSLGGPRQAAAPPARPPQALSQGLLFLLLLHQHRSPFNSWRPFSPGPGGSTFRFRPTLRVASSRGQTPNPVQDLVDGGGPVAPDHVGGRAEHGWQRRRRRRRGRHRQRGRGQPAAGTERL